MLNVKLARLKPALLRSAGGEKVNGPGISPLEGSLYFVVLDCASPDAKVLYMLVRHGASQ